jgi:hypothetical protein
MLTNTHLASPKATRANPPTSIHRNSPPAMHEHLTSIHRNSPPTMPTVHDHLTSTHGNSPPTEHPTSMHGNSPPTMHEHPTSIHGNSPPTVHDHLTSTHEHGSSPTSKHGNSPTSTHGDSPPTIHGCGDPHDNLLSNHVLPSIACDDLDSTAGCVAPCGLTSSCIVQSPAASRWDEWFGMFVILQFRTSKLHPELLRVTAARKQRTT